MATSADFAAGSITAFVISLVWNCLFVTPEKNKHPTYGKVIPSQAVLTQLFCSVSLVFAPGLFDALQAAAPPTIAYFKGLPSSYEKQWAIYVLVLEKPDCRPKVYIGSGINSERGVFKRFREYDAGRNFGWRAQDALNDGFVLVHKGLLCTMPMPTVALVPSLRIAFVAMEAMFAFTFWAMQSQTGYLASQTVCPWDILTFEYDGTCSHSALMENPYGDHDLSAEELEEQATFLKQRNAEKQSEWAYDWYVQKKDADPVAWNAPQLENVNAYKERHPDKVAANSKRYHAKAKAAKKYYCATCDKGFEGKSQLTRHLNARTLAAKHAGGMLET